ncbi:MAG: hypothetical protein J6X44_01425, partial [Thermoguttaceae bacterium]|nr:hypothetical protein [Thermoguttaceae bacterium]
MSLFILFAFILQTEAKMGEATTSLYVSQIQKLSDTMEVFPIDLIARDGPLSFFKKDQQNPSVSIREEIDSQSFKLFYDFCQHALDAT